jgi:CheY-like chemotaxis protein
METTVLIGCPVCGRRYRYDTARFGTSGIRLRCRSCEAVMRVEIPVPLLGESTAGAPRTGAQPEVPSREKIPVAVPATASREALPAASVFQEPVVGEKPVASGTPAPGLSAPSEPVLPAESAPLPVPPRERDAYAGPAVSATVQPELPEVPTVSLESSVPTDLEGAEKAVPSARSARLPEVDLSRVPPWERETSTDPELSATSEPALPAESATPPVPPWERGTNAEPAVSGTVQPDLPDEPAVSLESSVPGEPVPADTSAPETSATREPDQPAEPAPPPVDDDAAIHGTRIALEQEAERCLDEMFERGGDAQEAGALPVALVADRDEAMRELLSTVLRDSGFQVEEAIDGIEARRMLAAHRPAVVFLNAFLPQILGVTLCAEIKGHPELAAGTRVIIVGSLYRRDRFVRDPRDFYGADDFLDGSGSADEIRRRAADLCGELCGEKPGEVESGVDERGELMRLARIVAGDIILYNPQIAEREIAEGRFFDTFAQEIREGESLVAHRYSHVAGHQSLYHETLREAVLQHGEAAGIPAQPGT